MSNENYADLNDIYNLLEKNFTVLTAKLEKLEQLEQLLQRASTVSKESEAGEGLSAEVFAVIQEQVFGKKSCSEETSTRQDRRRKDIEQARGLVEELKKKRPEMSFIQESWPPGLPWPIKTELHDQHIQAGIWLELRNIRLILSKIS